MLKRRIVFDSDDDKQQYKRTKKNAIIVISDDESDFNDELDSDKESYFDNENDIIVISDEESQDEESQDESQDDESQDELEDESDFGDDELEDELESDDENNPRYLYLQQQINDDNPYEKAPKTISEDCQDWINKGLPEKHNFISEKIKNDFSLNRLLENGITEFEIPTNEIEEISKNIQICDICNKEKTTSLRTFLTIRYTKKKKIKKQCIFGCDCGLKVRLAYLYNKVINAIRIGYYIDNEHNNYTCEEIIDVFETLKEEVSKIKNNIKDKYSQEINEQKKSNEINQKRIVYYPFPNNLPCFY